MSVQARAEISTSTSVDPVTLEIFKNALESLADEMALIILRSAYSPIVRDSMDYSTAVCDALGRTIAQGLTNPIHLGSFPRVMERLIATHGATMAEGDGFLVNDPYVDGGMHLPDIFFIRPVYVNGERIGFTSALVHHTDIGGMAAGSMALNAEELFQEGLRLPLVKLYDRGVLNQSLFDVLKANSRMPDEIVGDLRAQISACDTVARSLARLAAKHGAAFQPLVEELHDYAERIVRQRVSDMPDGTVVGEDYIDGLGVDGARITFRVAVTINGSDISFDWAGTSDQVKGAINCPVTTTWSLAYAALRTVLGPGIPNCAGYQRNIAMTAPFGSIVNPRPYAACAARGVIAYRMLDAYFSAFGKLMPGLVPAGGEGGPTAISFSGRRADRDAYWLVTDGILGSWGGREKYDGVEGISNPGANISNQPIELMEARLPMLVEEYAYARNSGGAGRTRGGQAMVRRYRVLAGEAVMTLRSDRRRNLPLPLDGGLPGSPSISIIERSDGARELVPTMNMGTKLLGQDDVVVHIAAGGAGYGECLDRTPDAVLNDVLDDLITPDFAREVYGVVLDAQSELDLAATQTLRSRMAAQASESRAERQLQLFTEAVDARDVFGPMS